MDDYKDIMYLVRPRSSRPKMSLHDRAAQFAPFAALTGYDEQVKETARLVDQRIMLDEESYKILDSKLSIIKEHIKENIEITVMYFSYDLRKTGGAYLFKTGIIKKIDIDNHQIVFDNKDSIDIDDIFSITLPDKFEEMV